MYKRKHFFTALFTLSTASFFDYGLLQGELFRAGTLEMNLDLHGLYSCSVSQGFLKNCIRVRRSGDENLPSALSAVAETVVQLWQLYLSQPQTLTPQIERYFQGLFRPFFLAWRHKVKGIDLLAPEVDGQWREFVGLHFGQAWALLKSWSYRDFLWFVTDTAKKAAAKSELDQCQQAEYFLASINAGIPMLDQPYSAELFKFFLAHLVKYFDIVEAGEDVYTTIKKVVLNWTTNYILAEGAGARQVLAERNRFFESYLKLEREITISGQKPQAGMDSYYEKLRLEKLQERAFATIIGHVHGFGEDFALQDGKTHAQKVAKAIEAIRQEYQDNLLELKKLSNTRQVLVNDLCCCVYYMTIYIRMLDHRALFGTLPLCARRVVRLACNSLPSVLAKGHESLLPANFSEKPEPEIDPD